MHRDLTAGFENECHREPPASGVSFRNMGPAPLHLVSFHGSQTGDLNQPYPNSFVSGKMRFWDKLLAV